MGADHREQPICRPREVFKAGRAPRKNLQTVAFRLARVWARIPRLKSESPCQIVGILASGVSSGHSSTKTTQIHPVRLKIVSWQLKSRFLYCPCTNEELCLGHGSCQTASRAVHATPASRRFHPCLPATRFGFREASRASSRVDQEYNPEEARQATGQQE